MNYPALPLKERIVESILAGITIAMATIPEEIPVILTVFLAMGAWDLTKQNTLTKNMKAIETLGKVNVLCTDKTGTLTENKMKVEEIYEHNKAFKEIAYYACPLLAYDPMEIAIKNYLKTKIKTKKYKNIIKEYAFTPETKMMGILWNNNKLCVKGAYESVLPLCDLDSETYKVIEDKFIQIKENFTITNFIDSIYQGNKYEIKVSSNNQMIGTGNKISIFDKEGNKVSEYAAVVLGDTTGNGIVDVGDVAKLYQHLRGAIEMEREFWLASDVYQDSLLELNDVAKLYQYVRKGITSLEG